MKKYLVLLMLAAAMTAQAQQTTLFDTGWKFQKGNNKSASQPSYNDSKWRSVDLPHDWSIEPLEGQNGETVIGPFSKEGTQGGASTGETVGGTAWYRKTFVLDNLAALPVTILNFDGVYMDCDVWVNGKKAASHPYGYTAFDVDLTPYVKNGKNTIAVCVRNEGKNSRWYTGSGIYRHVRLIRKGETYLKNNGVFVSTKSVDGGTAILSVSAEKAGKELDNATLRLTLTGANGKSAAVKEIPFGGKEAKGTITVENVNLWSQDTPYLYKVKAELVSEQKVIDSDEFNIGIRTIHFDAKTGFTLNGKPVLLRGGCLHHDNGFLGAAAIDRAEERRVQLMKAFGFNAIRCSHNPQSREFFDACDRLGMLVVDESFDMWEREKNPQDYHRFFKQWADKDIESMVTRDRNHPSIIMWSIGNEINERAEELGYRITRQLYDDVKKYDSTRPVTEAICHLTDHPGQDWETTAPAYDILDVGGYNYLWGIYESDHEKHPERIMFGTESTPLESFDTWHQVEKNSYVIGDFLWTGMDHLGESGIGCSRYEDSSNKGFCQPWPWFINFSGDIDICGNKKPRSLYRDILWDISPITMNVHAPIPTGKKEDLSYWGWQNEVPSWNWNVDSIRATTGSNVLDVRVFSKYSVVRLMLNGRIIGEQKNGEGNKYISSFKVPYEPGILKAIGVIDGIEQVGTILSTTGKPAAIRLTADRDTINASRNDLSFVKIEVLDAQGNVVPTASVRLRLSVNGMAQIAGCGNACPTDMHSFNNPDACQTWRGKALAIIRPQQNPKPGTVTLTAEAAGLPTAKLEITVK